MIAVRVHVHAAIWHRDQLVVYRQTRRGAEHVALPGGRVRDRESVTDALRRELREELDREVEIGDLLFAGEVVTPSRHSLVLVFAARLSTRADIDGLDLVDPRRAQANPVMPPVLGELLNGRASARSRWLGDLYLNYRRARPRGGAT